MKYIVKLNKLIAAIFGHSYFDGLLWKYCVFFGYKIDQFYRTVTDFTRNILRIRDREQVVINISGSFCLPVNKLNLVEMIDYIDLQSEDPLS